MNRKLIDDVARAILYEGYILYPYRPSVKNSQRWTFGGLYPQTYAEAQTGSERWSSQTQCLVSSGSAGRCDVHIRFLHLVERSVGELCEEVAGSRWAEGDVPRYRPVSSLRVGDKLYEGWQEAVERAVSIEDAALCELADGPRRQEFAFASARSAEPIPGENGRIAGVFVREQQRLRGSVELYAERIRDGLFRVTVRVANCTDFRFSARTGRNEATMRSMASTHGLLFVREGEFMSLLDPPVGLGEAARQCRNEGTWPVLIGEPGAKDAMLTAPIILYDYPQIAAQSPGDLFDGTEIDEILTLRILTLTEEERAWARGIDSRARSLIERTESLAREQLAGLHGAMREGWTSRRADRDGGAN